MRKLSKSINIVISIIMASGVLASCSPKAEKTVSVTDPQTGEKIDVTVSDKLFSEDKEINIKNEKDGTSLQISKGEMPKTMPDFVELYPGASELSSVHASSKDPKKDGDVNMVNFKTKDTPSKVIEFYETKLALKGFKKEASANFGQMQMATLSNETTHQALQIMITQEPNKEAIVQLIYAAKQ